MGDEGTAHPTAAQRRKKSRDDYGSVFLPRTGPIQNQRAASPDKMRNEVPCQESSLKFAGSAAKRDFPRCGCRMGGYANYNRDLGMAQAKPIN